MSLQTKVRHLSSSWRRVLHLTDDSYFRNWCQLYIPLKHLHKFYNAQVLHKLSPTNNSVQHVTLSHEIAVHWDVTPVYARVPDIVTMYDPDFRIFSDGVIQCTDIMNHMYDHMKTFSSRIFHTLNTIRSELWSSRSRIVLTNRHWRVKTQPINQPPRLTPKFCKNDRIPLLTVSPKQASSSMSSIRLARSSAVDFCDGSQFSDPQ